MSARELITEHLDLWTGAVTKKSSSGRGSSGKVELTGIKKLRELILELAVRGKLIQQNLADESADSILKDIDTARGDSHTNRKKNKLSVSDDDTPYPVPSNWRWTHLGNISVINGGFAFKSANYRQSGVRVIRISDFNEQGFKADNVVRHEYTESLSSFSVEENNILMAMTGGTVGKSYLIKSLPEPMVVNQRVATIKLPLKVHSDFVYSVLKTGLIQNVIQDAKNSTNDNISMRDIQNFFVPIPPLEEQHRIVQKVDELMALCDRLEQQTSDQLEAHETLVDTLLGTLTQSENATELADNWARLAAHFDTLFTTEQSIDKLKQTILQLAVMGRLVEQDPEDQPATEVLKRIEAAKRRLTDENRKRAAKPLPPIEESERPFSLPPGWILSRMDEITDIQSGIAKGKKMSGKKTRTLPYLRVANVQRSSLDLSEVKEIEIADEEVERYLVQQRDLLITEGGDWDKVGRTAIWDGCIKPMAHQNHVFRARLVLDEQNERWLERYLNSQFARDYFASSSKQTTNLASINKTQLRSCTVPLPPIEEQARIVQKVDELMALCDKIRERLKTAKEKSLRLAEVIVFQAIN